MANEYIIYDTPEMPFEVCCEQKISEINTAFDKILREVEKRRKQLIQNVEKLRQECITWRQHNDRVKEKGNKMFTAVEHENYDEEFRSINEEHKQNLRRKLDSIDQEEAYYKERELQFHLDMNSTRSFIQALGRIRIKQTMDYFKTVDIPNKPLCAKFDSKRNLYYVMTSRNIQTLDETFQTINSVPILPPVDPRIKQLHVGGIAIGIDFMYISIPSHSLIQQYEFDGHLYGTIGKHGSGLGELMGPEGMEVHPSSQRLYVCEYENSRVQVFDHGKHHIFIGDIDNQFGQLRRPKSIAITNQGKVLVLQLSHPCVNVYSEDGIILSQFGCMFSNGDLRGIHWIGTNSNGVEIGTSIHGRVTLMLHHRDLVVELNSTQRAGCHTKLGGVAVGRKGQIIICDSNNKKIVCFDLNAYIPVFPVNK